MRASGVSIRRIGASVFLAGLLLALVAVLVGEFLAPPLAQMARATRPSSAMAASTSRAAAAPGCGTAD